MNRRGFFSGLMALIGVGAVAPAIDTREQGQEYTWPKAHEHKWEDTPYVLVYGTVAVQRGPQLRVCAGCGEVRMDVRQHRDAMLQRAYDQAHRAVTSRMTGFPSEVEA